MAKLGPRGPFGTSWAQLQDLGSIFDPPSRTYPIDFWGQVGASWGHVCPSWAQVGFKFGDFGGHLWAMLAHFSRKLAVTWPGCPAYRPKKAKDSPKMPTIAFKSSILGGFWVSCRLPESVTKIVTIQEGLHFKQK